MKIGFIGAGKVGFSLGKFFACNHIQVTGYYSRHPESAIAAAKFTETFFYKDISQLVKESDAIFITVPDGQIQSVYRELKELEITEKQICHCSGAMSSEEAFPDAKAHGAYRYSIHPLFPISSKYEAYRNLADAFFCLEGDAEHMDMWQALFAGLGVRTRRIEGADKTRYHAACSLASNLVCAMLQESMELFAACGFSKEEALDALRPLAMYNMEQILSRGPVEALTGPVERGDTATVRKHLSCLEDPRDRQMYASASKKLVSMAKKKHPERNYQSMEDCICEGFHSAIRMEEREDCFA